MTEPGPATDPAAIRAWLGILHGASPGLVHISHTGNWQGSRHTDLDQAAQHAAHLDATGPAGVYVRMTTLRPDAPDRGRGSAADSAALPALWADLDIAGPGHKTAKSLPPDEACARSIVVEAGLPDPSVWIHSGGGLYPIWLFDQPWVLGDDLAAAEVLSAGWHSAIGAAAERLGFTADTAVKDLARILRVPGTVNRKVDGQPALCRIVDGTAHRYTLADLRQALGAALAAHPPTPPAARPSTSTTPGIGPASGDRAGDRPGDDYTAHTTWADILTARGWRLHYTSGEESHWTRPGKDTGTSATTNYGGSDRIKVFSDNAGVPVDGTHSRYEFVVHADYGGDFAAATRALAAAGYGPPPAPARTGAQINAELLELAGPGARRPFDPPPSPTGSNGQAGTQSTAAQSGFVHPAYGLLAAKFVAAIEQGHRFAVDAAERLYRYHDGVWRPDGENAIHRRAVDLLGNQYRMAHANTAVKMIKIREPLITDDTADTRYLNLPNGLLDWQTGELCPHDPAVPSTIRIPVAWDPAATCPTILAWMAQVFPPDALQFALEVIGYTLMNDNPLHKAVLLFGSGRNGKGTFLRLLKALVGAYNVAAVTPQSLDENRFRAAELWGKLANLVGDVDPRIFKATETFKQITGGDMITAERKYGQPFNFHARALMIAAFNALPRTADTSEGFFSRWIVVPFSGYFPAGVADPTLDRRLHSPAELRGLLVAAVTALRRLMERGAFAIPPSVEEQTKAYRLAADPVRAFLADEGLAGDGQSFLARSDLYRRYTGWCEIHGHHALAAASLYERLPAAAADTLAVQIHPHKQHGTRGWTGLALTPQASDWAANVAGGNRW